MKTNNIEVLEKSLGLLEDKRNNIYFLIYDTQGMPFASVQQTYEYVKILKENGYNVTLLHEDEKYTDVSAWMGEEYSNLPHLNIKKDNVSLSISDIVIIPEMYPNVMEKLKNIACKKIVFSQNYSSILELLNFGVRWQNYGVNDVITTSLEQKEYIQSLFHTINVHVIDPIISEDVTYKKTFEKPQISIFGRDQSDVIKFIKEFYLKYPHLSWFNFREIRGLSLKDMSNVINESAFCIWLDSSSSFGTFPIESMKLKKHVIGLIPELIPGWMKKENEETLELNENGIWFSDKFNLINATAAFIKLWLDDKLPNEIIENGLLTSSKFTNKEKFKNSVLSYFENVRKELIEKVQTTLNNEKVNA